MTPLEYRTHKGNLIAQEIAARVRAQEASLNVDEAKATGDEGKIEDATLRYIMAVAELEDLMHQTGEYD